MSLAKIKGLEYPLEAIFDGQFFFNIPLFQRPYSWTTEEAGELLDDFLGSLDSEDESNSYFLGSIVLIKEDNSLKPEAQVIDGQQRLITLTILFSVLRYRLRELQSEKIPNDLTKRIYKEADEINGKPATYILTLRRDESFFREYVQNDDEKSKIKGIKQLVELTNTEKFTESQKNIKYNAELFYRELEVKSEFELTRLVKFMFRQCFMIVVSTPDSDSAFRIFEILNDRGLNLTHADKLKSELIGEIHEPNQQESEAKLWESMEDQLGQKAFSDLFSHIRMIEHTEKPRNDILTEFRKWVVVPIADPIKVIQEIMKYATIYYDIINEAYASRYASSNEAEEINISLGWLNKIDNKNWLPPAILYMSLHKDPNELNRFFTNLERLASGLMIRRANVNERIRRYGDVLNAIKKDQDLYDETSPLQLASEERAEIIEKLDGDLFLESQFRLYVLLRLNEAYLEKGVQFTYSKGVTIEHVLPQTLPPGGCWEKWFPSELDHKTYVHKLGNLILLTGPKNHGNDEFEEKKKEYLDEKYGIISFPLSMKAITKETKWNKEVIVRRQKEQIEKLKEIWRL